MTDADRIALVEEYHLDVWYLDELQPQAKRVPLGWVVDYGEPDLSLWLDAQGFDGGSSLVVGASSWREAVDRAAELLGVLDSGRPLSVLRAPDGGANG